jgi:hypothetical protein
MKNLIAYYSFTSNNAKLATHLQKQLKCDIVRIETVGRRTGFSILLDLVFKRKPRLRPLDLNVKDYDHIFVVAPIWGGRIAAPIKSFLMNEKQSIGRYSFISLCGGGNPKQAENVREEMTSSAQKPPSNVLELWINDLLPPEKKNTIKYTSGFRIEDDGFGPFEDKIQHFMHGEQQPAKEKVETLRENGKSGQRPITV